MQFLITAGIRVSVETFYQQEVSKPEKNEFMFSYRITIENESDSVVKLIKRKWKIVDAYCRERYVEGEGIMGLQPIISPNKCHQYVSGCQLKTDIGKMSGTYLMKRIADNHFFEVDIPSFNFVAPFKLN